MARVRSLRSVLAVACTLALAGLVLASTVSGGTNRVGSSGKSQADPFKLMILTSIGTPITNFVEVPPAMQTAVDAINKAGGFKGRQVELVVCNDLGNAVGSAACARRAVDEKMDNVVLQSGFSAVINPILDTAKIPRVGALVTSPAADYRNPYVFPFRVGPALFAGMPFIAKKAGAKRIATIQVAVAIAFSNTALVAAATPASGIKYAGNVVVPIGSTDFSTAVQQLRDMRADAVGIFIANSQMPSFVQALKQFGLKMLIVGNTSGNNEAVLKAVGADVSDGWVATSVTPPATATNVPAVARFKSAMNAAGQNAYVDNTGAFIAWLDVYAIKAVVDTVKGPLTTTSLLAAARAAKTGLSVQGFYKWSPGQRGPAVYPNAPNGQVFFTTAKGTQWFLDSPLAFDVWKAIGIARK